MSQLSAAGTAFVVLSFVIIVSYSCTVSYIYIIYATYLISQNLICRLKDAVQSDLRMCTKEPSFYYTNSLFRFLFHFMVLQSLIVVS
jgi:hypothetical protein